MRKALIIVGAIIVVLIAAVGIFIATFDVNQYHGQIQAQLETALGRKVTLGNMSLGILPLAFRVQNIVIADDPSLHSRKDFLQAQELDVSVALFPLLSKQIEVDSVNLDRPSVEMIKNKEGVWNFDSIGKTAPKSGSSSSSQPVALNKLTIKDGQVAMTDLQAGSPRSVYDHIDVTLTDFAPNKPFSLDVAAHLPGAAGQEVELKGDGGPVATNAVATPFKGTLKLKDVEIAGLQKFLDSPALVGTDGIISGETKISSESGSMAASGQIKIEKAKVHNVELGYPVTADYDVSDNLNSDLLTVRNTTIKLGDTPLNIDGTVNSKSNPAQVDLTLKASNVSIAEMAQLSAAAGTAFAPGMKVSGTVNADIQVRGPADKPALTGTVSARSIEASGGGVAQPVQVPSLTLTMTPTDVHSDAFNIVSGGTTVSSQFTLKDYMAKSPSIDATIRSPNAQLPAILAIAKAYGVTSLNAITGQGTLSLDLRAAGPMQSVASNDVARALNGTVKLAFNNVRYTGVDIDHELESIGKFGGGSSGTDKGYTDISKVTGDIAVKSGVANTSNLQALLDIGTINVTGTANLVDQALNMKVTALLTKEATTKAGGAAVGGFMTTALADSNGNLVIPAIVTGTFQHPHYAPDLEAMAQMKLNGVGGILGGLLGQKTGGQPGAQQQNPVNQIMGLFGKKKQ